MKRRFNVRARKFALLLLAAALTAALPARAGVVAIYTFDNPNNPLEDSSGNGHHLTTGAGGLPVWGATNGFGGSGGYDFSDDRLTAPIDINPAAMPRMTWGAWVRTDTLSAALRPKVMGHDDNGWDRTIGLDNRNPATLRYTTFTGDDPVNNSGPVENTPSPVSTTAWTFIAAAYDQVAKTVTMYVDLDASTTNDALVAVTEPGAFGPGFSTVTIGAHRADSTSSSAWDGAMDNIFIYDEVLDAAALTALRNSFNTQPPPRIFSFRASPPVSLAGQPVTLAWSTAGAEALSINMGAPVINGATNSVVVNPAATTAYTLTASNGGGVVTAQVTVSVNVTLLPPRITEFLASNGGSLKDGNTNSSDWIEIFNPNPFTISLAGFGLQDSATTWVFPDVQIGGGGFLIVFASGQTNSGYMDPAGYWHTTFGLSANGEVLRLLATNGVTVLSLFTNVPVQRSDVSWGADPGTGTNGFLVPPTPGLPNGPAFSDFVSDTKFSVDRGFYDAPTNVTITCATTNASIAYTTDGSEPSLTQGTVVPPPSATNTPSAVVAITRTTTLRARAFRPGWVPTGVDTHTYLLLTNVIDQSNNPPGFPPTWGAYVGANQGGGVSFTLGQPVPADYAMNPVIVNTASRTGMVAALRALPTISIVGDPADLFGSEGILSNPFKDVDGTGVATNNPFIPDRRCSVEWIQPDGAQVLQVNCGVRLVGGWSRHYEAAAKKSLRLSFTSEFGPAKLKFPLFGPNEVDEFDQVQLRATFSDGWVDNAVPAQFMRDNFVRDTYLAMGQPGSRGTYVHLYINGLYWGIYNPSERPDDDYAASHYGGSSEDYDALKHQGLSSASGNPPQDSYEVIGGSAVRWQEALTLSGLDLSVATNYARFKQYVNVTSLADYIILNTFLGNTDWPNKNWYAFGRRDGADGGFKFSPWDSEYSINSLGADRVNVTGTLTPTRFYSRARLSAEFRLHFADRVHQHAFNQGPLTSTGMIARYTALAGALEPAMDAEAARWGDSPGTRHGVRDFRKSHWLATRDSILSGYFPARPPIALAQYRANALYPTNDAPEFSQHGGTLNPPILNFLGAPLAGTVYYTTNGADPRLEGGAVNPLSVALPGGTTTQGFFGFEATGWNYFVTSNGLGDSSLTNGAAGYDVTNWKHPDFNDDAWPSGQAMLGYGVINTRTIRTTVGFGGNIFSRHPTTYFRKDFVVADAADIGELILDVIRDDGAILYLNGREIARSNLGAGNQTYGNFATVEATPEEAVVRFRYTPPPGVLRNGTNVLAIELHQFNAANSDLGLDVAMQAVPTSAIKLARSGPVKARTLAPNGEWSALTEAFFSVGAIPAAPGNLVFSEIHYNPQGPVTPAELALPGLTGDDFEFLELLNIHSASDIDLGGAFFSTGIDFPFFNLVLAPGQRAVVVRNLGAYFARYGNYSNVVGQYSGRLSNNGETLTLVNSTGGVIVSVSYGVSGLWDASANGLGRSLVLTDPFNTPTNELGKSYRWSASAAYGGTPGGVTDGGAVPPRVVINEVLAHTTLPQQDSIELFNMTDATVNIGGWFLSDSGARPLKLRIPTNTVLAAGGYAVFTENHFNPTPLTPGTNDFALDGAAGDEVYLVIPTADGQRAQTFVDHVAFGSTFDGESLGRFPNGSGRFTPMSSLTLGASNAGPRFGPLLISEVNYHPGPPSPAALALLPTLVGDDLEFIEIYNAGGAAADLTNWRLRGEVDFNFATNSTLAAGAALLVINFNPASPANASRLAAFRTHYGLAPAVPLVGGYSQKLNNSEGAVRLERPDAPPVDNPLYVPRVVEDELIYNDLAPWPLVADGLGSSLHRISPTAFAGLSVAWRAAVPAPGSAEFVPAPVLQVTLTSGGAQAMLGWVSQSGATYTVQHSASLTGWTSLDANVPSGGAFTTHAVPTTGAARFFRIFRNP